MTIEAYIRATKILEEVEQLEEQRGSLDSEYEPDKFRDISVKILELGYEFAAL